MLWTYGVISRRFLVFGTEKVAITLFVDVDALVQQVFDHCRVLSDDGHVQYIFS